MSPSRLLSTWVVFATGAVVCALVGLFTGPSELSTAALLRDWLSPTATGHDAARAILIDVRAMRVSGSFAVGAALSLAGVLLQAATRNPLADPYLVGTSAGATLAAVGLGAVVSGLVVTVPAGWVQALPWLQPAAAFAGAMVAVSLAFGLASVGGPASPVRVLLAGLVLTAFCGAATSFLLYQASDLQLRAATAWLMGGVLVSSPWQLVPALTALTVATTWGMARAVHLNALGLGADGARGVGVDETSVLKTSVWLSAALAGVAVALAGIIGFVGLLVPHGLRAMFGRDHRVLVPGSVMLGGGFVILADALSRVLIAPAELPVGILTALTGCPLLLALLRRRHRGASQASAAFGGTGEPTGRGPNAAPSHGAETAVEAPLLLRCAQLTVTYPAAAEPALRDVGLAFGAGQLVALVGPNGSGKSTLLRALAGAVGSIGTIEIPRPQDGGDDSADVATTIAWLPQRLWHEPGATVAELVMLGRTAHLARTARGRLFGQPSAADRAAVDDALQAAEIELLRERAVETLSGGQRQRAFLAMTMAQRAAVMLLDEPTTALDLPSAAAVLDNLKAWVQRTDGLAVIAVHDLQVALARADRVVVLSEGVVVADDIASSPAVRAGLMNAFGPSIDEFVAPR